MNDKEQNDHFGDDLDNLVDRYSENDMTYAVIVGILQMKIHLLCAEASRLRDEDHEKGHEPQD